MAESLAKAIKGTFLSRILAIYESGDFSGVDLLPLGKDDKILSEATDFEKACWVRQVASQQEALQKVKEGASEDSDEVQLLLGERDAVRRIFHTLVFQRVGNKAMTLREGWKIAELTQENDDCDCEACRGRRSKTRSKSRGVGFIIFG